MLGNLAVLCKDCNTAKEPLTAREWTELLASMNGWPPDIRKNLLARLKAGSRVARMSTGRSGRDLPESVHPA